MCVSFSFVARLMTIVVVVSALFTTMIWSVTGRPLESSWLPTACASVGFVSASATRLPASGGVLASFE